jgi:choline dehydrogenase-like flavoprotein
VDDYDAVVVGASVAGCTAATFLGRQGARVALLERSPNEERGELARSIRLGSMPPGRCCPSSWRA